MGSSRSDRRKKRDGRRYASIKMATTINLNSRFKRTWNPKGRLQCKKQLIARLKVVVDCRTSIRDRRCDDVQDAWLGNYLIRIEPPLLSEYVVHDIVSVNHRGLRKEAKRIHHPPIAQIVVVEPSPLLRLVGQAINRRARTGRRSVQAIECIKQLPDYARSSVNLSNRCISRFLAALDSRSTQRSFWVIRRRRVLDQSHRLMRPSAFPVGCQLGGGSYNQEHCISKHPQDPPAATPRMPPHSMTNERWNSSRRLPRLEFVRALSLIMERTDLSSFDSRVGPGPDGERCGSTDAGTM